ncbi:hypothetical protein F4561_005066 [Lipingzhangella halophila]|uniref:Uncharacterized protein n=1 Tax=Lipingzhangella halophila TaxID=1783352 RepID=A0A7W7W4W8_9ACTN|nr:hypothetical protein [Lipingzhangella halophila]MBB4934246.1 hypothetical protein [Lipingzhangella halophila]
MSGTLNQEQALERVEQHIGNATANLPDSLHTESLGVIDGASCDDPTDNGPKVRIIVSHKYWLDGLQPEDNEHHAELLHQHWTNNGYTVLTDDRPDEIYISVENNEDGFRMSLQESAEGSLSLGASSPCIWPNGSPE